MVTHGAGVLLLLLSLDASLLQAALALSGDVFRSPVQLPQLLLSPLELVLVLSQLLHTDKEVRW